MTEEELTAHMQAEVDELVPPKIMKLIQHQHNLIMMFDFYRSQGGQTPPYIQQEMGRAEKAIIIQLEIENRQGGAYHELEKKIKEGVPENETRKSNPLRQRLNESGAQKQSRFARRGV